MADEDAQQNDADAQDVEAATTTAPAKKPAPTKRKPKQLPPYRVLLHNDDVNTFDHVIRSVVRLTPIPPEEAVVKAIERMRRALPCCLSRTSNEPSSMSSNSPR